jgi:hypothetical protein
MSGIDFIEKLITDVARHEVNLWVVFAWNCLLTVGVIIALTKAKDRR